LSRVTLLGRLALGVIVALALVGEARAKDAERAKALAARTPPQLRDAVVALHKSGRSVDAYQTYARESGEDLATARAVVELLAEGAP
jgi:1,6-anhydro-N-acetylmuramate kinase